MNRIIFIFFILFYFSNAEAKIQVSSLLGDNMVLQRNAKVKLWGKTDPNKKLTVYTSWNNSKTNTISDENGNWEIKVKTTGAGGPYNITIASTTEKVVLKNILLGEVWICSGQSNMEMPMSGFDQQFVRGGENFILEANNNNIRLFNVQRCAVDTPKTTCEGNWAVASGENVSKFSAVAYLYAKILQQRLNVPIGIVCSTWGGTFIEAWMSKEALSNFPDAYKRRCDLNFSINQRGCKLYNGMISPLLNLAFKGVIWYQGESNVQVYTGDYAQLMPAMVRDWRKKFDNGNFPFYYVQIAPYSYDNPNGLISAFLREQQLQASVTIPNCGIISTIDIGDENVIHPAEKEMVAKRLSYLALAKTYHEKRIPYKSPTFKKLTIKDSLAIISFNNVPKDLTTNGKAIECFEIAGEDSVFYPAKVIVNSKQVRVWSDMVKVPVAVRYGFCNFPKTNGYLYSTDGLPVFSFRTDNWKK